LRKRYRKVPLLNGMLLANGGQKSLIGPKNMAL